MPAKEIFKLTNNFTQSGAQGICTAGSLAWAKACLKKRGHVNSFSEVGSFHNLNIQMATIRRYDFQPRKQTETAGLKLIREFQVKSIEEVIGKVKSNSPHVAIFWTDYHTMGYRYAHHDKEFFDMEAGLFRAKHTKDIQAKMEEVFSKKGYGIVKGVRIVSLL